ncbi:MAG: hypothetical protein FJX80_01680 [Bacteroidetes bacterium]|nr:hypothetical protein [Bacteroidota bacterium]
MLRFLISFISLNLVFSLKVNAQSQLLSAECRAYIFHIVRQSPVLEKNIGHAFEYNGPLIKLKNGKDKINYDSIEYILINQPDLLTIQENEVNKASKGIIAELANKTAIWILNKSLNAIRCNKTEYDKEFLDHYIATFQEKLDNHIKKSKVFDLLFEVNTSPIFNASLSLYDRDLLLFGLGYIKAEDRKKILDAQNEAVRICIEHRAKRIFELLGGHYQQYENFLLAAGDGSYTAGLLEEQERDEDGNWNNGFPKAVGLFPYQLEIKEEQLYTSRIASQQMETFGDNIQTNLHFDVWGYNTNKQTTVIIERRNKSYRLYGSSNTRHLSPDSTLSSGITFQKIINDLNNAHFQILQKKLHGEGGLLTQENKLLSQLSETETALQDLYSAQEYPAKKSTKKRKKVQPEGLEETTNRINELKDELSSLREDIEPLLEIYNETKNLIDYYQKNLGNPMVSYVKKDGIFIYEDSCYFNPNTQEFITPRSDKKESLQIRLISIPDDLKGTSTDEVMLHVSKTDFNALASPDLHLVLKDRFSSDGVEFKTAFNFTGEDSLKLKMFFASYNNHSPIVFELNGHGIGVWKNNTIIKDLSPKELSAYPGATDTERSNAKESFQFSSLRRTQLTVKKAHQLIIKIESFTDPVKSNFISKNTKLMDLKKLGKITMNDALSAERSVSMLDGFSEAFLSLAQKEMKKEFYMDFHKKYQQALSESVVFVSNIPLSLKSFYDLR